MINVLLISIILYSIEREWEFKVRESIGLSERSKLKGRGEVCEKGKVRQALFIDCFILFYLK